MPQLYTCLSQKHHGRVGYKDGVSWNYPCTLAGELSKNGYYTECIGKMHVHPQRNLVGFHHIELHNGVLEYHRKPNVDYSEHQSVADDYLYEMGKSGLPNAILDSGIECNSWVARPWMYDEADHPTNWVTTRSIDFLRRRDRSKPFFLMASYVRPHPPFDAPACYFDMYRDYIHGEHSGGGISTQYIITKTDKYIWYSQTGVEQYFDLENDPTELHNAISDAKYQDRIAKLRSLLIDELKDREEGYVQNGELIVGQTPVACLKHILEE